jgi:hypothetical protein
MLSDHSWQDLAAAEPTQGDSQAGQRPDLLLTAGQAQRGTTGRTCSPPAHKFHHVLQEQLVKLNPFFYGAIFVRSGNFLLDFLLIWNKKYWSYSYSHVKKEKN